MYVLELDLKFGLVGGETTYSGPDGWSWRLLAAAFFREWLRCCGRSAAGPTRPIANAPAPLAVAAYNAGPGNVNKWLRANGDPRTGAVDWIDWLERIPIYETKNYVQRVLENAVVYEEIYPQNSSYRGPNKLTRLMPGKRTPG